MNAIPNAACAIALAASVAACSSSSGPSEPRAAFREPVLTTVEALGRPGVEILRDFLVGDVNGDGRPDALVGYADSFAGRSSYSLYLNAGAGRFQEGVPVHDLWDARLADFNRDGRLDLAGCNGSGPRILLGGGDGVTWADVPLPSTGTCERTAVGDFDGDGRPDFAFGMRGAGDGLTSFAVIRMAGDGTFHPMGPVQFVDGLPNDRAGYLEFVPGNFDGDNRADLAVFFSTTVEGFRPEIRVSNGDGTFTRTWPQGAYPDEFTRRSVINRLAGDINGDGRADLVLWAWGHTIPVPPVFPGGGQPAPAPPPPLAFSLLGQGNGTFTLSSWSVQLPTGISALGDIDRDGRPDLLHIQLMQGEPTQLQARFGLGDGAFGDPVTVAPPSNHASGLTVLVDLDGDGRLDVLVADMQLAAFLAK